MSNVLIAFKNLIQNPITTLVAYYEGNNRANNMGDALETYIKDLFAGSSNQSKANALASHRQVFAFLGNTSNPPDMILHNGDAIEVKKIQTKRASLALNSSHPKDLLYSNSPMITKDCKKSDGGVWVSKDMVYIIGVAPKNALQGVWFIYGDCYAADQGVYNKIKNNIITSIKQSSGVQLANTKELARVNKVDPLGITYLRVRGMWGIDNPISVFDYLNLTTDTTFFSHLIMKKSKFETFSLQDRTDLMNITQNNANFKMRNVPISDPNNPALTIDAIVFSFTI